jgi:hypothetical protein
VERRGIASRDRRDEITRGRMNRTRDPWPPPKKTAARENLGGQLKTVLGGSGKANDSASSLSAQAALAPGFVVIESKASGREVVVGRCDDEETALSVLRLLAWAGAVARIERAS